MKLYTAANSNFGARVAIAARAKGIALAEAPLPAGGLRSPAFLEINPLARIPVLVLDGAMVLPESETILRYLEARFPEPSLYPAGAAARAAIDRAGRIMDLYVMAPVIRLFPHLDPARRDAAVVADEVERWRAGLGVLAHFLRDPLPEVPAGVSLADCILAPSLHLCTRIAALLDLPGDPVADHPALAAYYRQMARHPIVGPVLDALTASQAEKDAGQGLPALASRHRALAGMSLS